jgi:AraC family transcriptional regulator
LPRRADATKLDGVATAVLPVPAEPRAAYHRQAVERAIAAMSERLDEQFSLETLAGLAFFSPYHFHRVFRNVTGVPPRRFLSALRIEEAKRLLLTSDLSVTDICFEVGYHSLGTFTSQFTRFVGVSPRRLREFARSDGADGHPSPQNAAPRPDAATPAVHGRLDVPANGSSTLVAVGLFPTAVAEGCPVGCTLTAAPGTYELSAKHTGRFHVLALSIPQADDLTGLLLRDDDAHVATGGPVTVRRGRSASRVDLVLRPRRVTDPPVLLSPVLLAAGEHAAVA